jgi:hypothetical protein
VVVLAVELLPALLMLEEHRLAVVQVGADVVVVVVEVVAVEVEVVEEVAEVGAGAGVVEVEDVV